MGSSISTNSTLNSCPSGVFQTLRALKPSLARMIGPQPAQTFRANRTVLSFNALYFETPLTGGSFSPGWKVYSLTVVTLCWSAASAFWPSCLGSIFCGGWLGPPGRRGAIRSLR